MYLVNSNYSPHIINKIYLFAIMHHNMQKLNKAALKQILLLALSMSMVFLFAYLYFGMELITGIL